MSIQKIEYLLDGTGSVGRHYQFVISANQMANLERAMLLIQSRILRLQFKPTQPLFCVPLFTGRAGIIRKSVYVSGLKAYHKVGPENGCGKLDHGSGGIVPLRIT